MTLNHGSRVLLQVQDGNCNLKVSSNLEKFPFLKCASGNRALNFMGNFRKFPRNFLETVRVLTGQKTVRVGMWSRILISNVLLLVKDSFTENYWRNLDQTGSFARQRFFHRKPLKKFWSKRFFYALKVLLQKIFKEILIKISWVITQSRSKRLFFPWKVLLKKYRRNLDQKCSFPGQRFFSRKLSKKSWSKGSFIR